MQKMVYKFDIKDHTNAKAWLIEGNSPTGKHKITVAMFYYDYGVPKEAVEQAAQAFTDQLNTYPLEVEQ